MAQCSMNLNKKGFRSFSNRRTCALRRLGWIAFASLCVVSSGIHFANAQQLGSKLQPPTSIAAPQLPQVSKTPVVASPEEVIPKVAEHRLSLSDLEQMALVSNPSITKASALVGAARGNWLQVGLLPNPTVGYEGQQLGSGGQAEQHGVMIGQEFVRGGKLRLNRAVAEQELSKAMQTLSIQQQKVLTDVRITFYQVLLAQRQIDLTENLVQIAAQGAKAVDALFKGKEGTRADVLQAQLEVENARVLATNARNRHQSAWRGLCAVTGNPHLPPQALAGDAYAPPREFDFEQTLTRMQSISPEMDAARSEISRARFALERANAEPIPNVSVQGLFNFVDNGVSDGGPDAGISISMPIPVFNKNQGASLQAEHEIMAAEQAMAQLSLGFQARLAPTFERFANARNQVQRYREAILPAAQESLDLTRQAYQAGESGFLALLTAQRTFFQTNLNYLESLRQLRTAEAEIEGLLLMDSLNTGNVR